MQKKKIAKTNSFKDRVIEVVKKIPKGKTLSYKQVAKQAGSQNAFRVVGNIMKNNQDKNIPCHRVINSNGKIGKYNGLQGKSKEKILRRENPALKNDIKGFKDNLPKHEFSSRF